ncbi:hypothetical protein M0220_12990 [Halomonas qinghailakensis]|uniref:LapA adhesin domain-containing protein n=1 Tax=Halomonas qinghailakensis TaxID=2937790 RepID=A0AA46TQK8_9GAMM|nr:immunoglobulin-like domain-containing protein [Halomonas sp. ZZQ-149]UYO73787.1 hypothetical protein M0220_12990 [Halomonas sp. ZZQ-149]
MPRPTSAARRQTATNFSGSDNSGYEDLVLVNNATSHEVDDTIDTVNATLTSSLAAGGNEDGATVTYTVTLDNAPTTEETFTFDVNGEQQTITVAANELTGSTNFTFNDPDVFLDDNVISAPTNFSGSDNSGYEDLVLVNNATSHEVDDTIDTVNATLTSSLAAGGNEDGATVTYTVTLDNAPTTEETFTFDVNGEQQTITVAANELTGSTNFTFNDPDVFLDDNVISAPTNFSGSDNSGYEDLVLVNNATSHEVDDTIDTVNATLTSSLAAGGNEDGATVTYTVTLDNAPTTEETFTFDVNGEQQTITVAANELTGSTNFTFNDPDVFLDDNVISAPTNFSGSDNSGYEDLVLVNNATSHEVDDTIDTVNATLTSSLAAGGNEDGATVTYTVTLDNAPTTEETFTFDVNGEQQTITVAANELTGSTNFTFNDPDVFLDDNVISAPTNFSGSDNSGYEDLVLVNNATSHEVDDTIDTVNATLTSSLAAGGNEDGATVTYTVTLDNAPTTEETFTFDVNGEQQTITVAANELTGSTNFTFNDPDVFLDDNVISAPTNFSGSDNSGYEDLVLVNNATSHEVDDTIDTVNATLTSSLAAGGNEDGATVTYTVTLDNAPTTEETFTFDVNGEQQTITVAANELTGSTNFTFNDPDVFLDDNVISAPTNFSGSDNSGYEDLVLVNNATSHEVDDTIDTVNATLTSSLAAGGNEDGATVTYTVTLDNAPTTEETFTFDVNGEQQTITVAANELTGSTNFTFNDPDVFLDDNVISAPTNFSGSDNSGYEDLVLVNNATSHEVDDTIDTVNATLTSSLAAGGNEDGATVTYTVTLDNAPTTEETFHLRC